MDRGSEPVSGPAVEVAAEVGDENEQRTLWSRPLRSPSPFGAEVYINGAFLWAGMSRDKSVEIGRDGEI